MVIMKKFARKLVPFIPPVAVYLIFSVLRPETFLSFDTLFMLFIQSIIATLIAWGMSFNLIAGVIDFSVGAEVALAGVVGAYLTRSLGVFGLIAGCLLTAAVTGMVKAFIMDAIKAGSMVLSIAFTYIIASLSSIIAAAVPLIVSSENTILGRTPFLIAIFVIMGTVMYLLNKYSTFGAKTRAIGGNETIAVASGIKPRIVRIETVMLASLYMGVTAIVQVSRGAGAAATQGLQSMQSVFVSMMSFFLASVFASYIDLTIGIISGAMCFTILETGLISVNMPSNYKNCFVGVGLLLIIALFGISEARQKQKIMLKQSQERHKLAAEANSAE